MDSKDYYRRARLAKSRGNYDEFSAIVNEGLVEYPDDFNLLLDKAELCIRDSDYCAALNIYEHCWNHINFPCVKSKNYLAYKVLCCLKCLSVIDKKYYTIMCSVYEYLLEIGHAFKRKDVALIASVSDIANDEDIKNIVVEVEKARLGFERILYDQNNAPLIGITKEGTAKLIWTEEELPYTYIDILKYNNLIKCFKEEYPPLSEGDFNFYNSGIEKACEISADSSLPLIRYYIEKYSREKQKSETDAVLFADDIKYYSGILYGLDKCYQIQKKCELCNAELRVLLLGLYDDIDYTLIRPVYGSRIQYSIKFFDSIEELNSVLCSEQTKCMVLVHSEKKIDIPNDQTLNAVFEKGLHEIKIKRNSRGKVKTQEQVAEGLSQAVFNKVKSEYRLLNSIEDEDMTDW